MKTSRRHKIAHSAVVRSVKPRKSEKAKRHKRKTHKRNTRNKVMNGGGIHKKLKVYVIRHSGNLKCVIVRVEAIVGLDTIYLFFDAKLENRDLKQFLCAALGLNGYDDKVDIQPLLQTFFVADPNQALNYLFVKLSGTTGYILSSGVLDYTKDYLPLSDVHVKKHKVNFKISGNGKTIIDRLTLYFQPNSLYTFKDISDEVNTSNEVGPQRFDSREFKLWDVDNISKRFKRPTENKNQTNLLI